MIKDSIAVAQDTSLPVGKKAIIIFKKLSIVTLMVLTVYFLMTVSAHYV